MTSSCWLEAAGAEAEAFGHASAVEEEEGERGTAGAEWRRLELELADQELMRSREGGKAWEVGHKELEAEEGPQLDQRACDDEPQQKQKQEVWELEEQLAALEERLQPSEPEAHKEAEAQGLASVRHEQQPQTFFPRWRWREVPTAAVAKEEGEEGVGLQAHSFGWE